MTGYNNFMRYFWLVVAVVTLIVVTVMGFKDGFDRWYQYYLWSFIGFIMYFMKTKMMKRFEKHSEFLDNQRKENKQK